MNISSINGSSYLSSLSGVSQSNDTSQTLATTQQASSGSAASFSMSKGGELMSKLKQLQSSDPAKFKTVMSDIASKLSSDASSSGDTKLKSLAAKFQSAAQSGDLSAFGPPPGAQGGPPPGGASGAHHGHHHHGGGGGGPSNAEQSVMQSVLDEVGQALSGSSTSATSPG